jgi:hypothetical protein
MQFMLVIYENGKRVEQGYNQAEMSEYDALGKQFSKSVRGGNAPQPKTTAKTVRVRNGKLATLRVHSPLPRSSSAATSSSKRPISRRLLP